MEVKRMQKFNKAAAATILAASSATIALPQNASAATFKDLDPTKDYYQPVLELLNKKIVSGYTDNTFRPMASVTRGQAAKMLALSLGLETDKAKVKNPNFKDVTTQNGFYGYISALANAGIISGFADKTFRTNEPITRAQMAKIVTLGYKFSVATKLNHHFTDVLSTNGHAYYIQTLSDLGITKGTTPTTYSPGRAVTRGQLATFISRANKAEASKPKYMINDIVGDKVYINSVAHTVSASLKSIFNEANREVLIGAYVDGTISGTTLTSLSNLTINNNGTSSRILTFDGQNSTYNGKLTIVGSYVRFKNWTLNGEVLVAETPHATLADYVFTVASTTLFGLIDWSTPTKPGDDTLNPPSNNELTPSTGNGNSSKYTAKMTSIAKYVDFTNCTVKNLVIEQNRTYITATKTLPKVTIARDVQQVEIYANMTTLYIESDLNLDIFGVHNIQTAYKNSYRDVFFNTDSYIKTLIVDNSYGWIDLGDHVYIEKVIIPPNKTPLDIFDDYKTDTDKIGTIEDSNGKEVDRDPIENIEIKDVEPPRILRLRVDGDSFSAQVLLRTNEDGKYYYSVVERGATAPTVREILQGHGVTSGNGQWLADIEDTFLIRNLESETKYDLYLVYVDNAGNISSKEVKEFDTKDGTPPVVNSLKLMPLAGGKRLEMSFQPTEEGTYYYYYERGSQLSNHTVDYIIEKGEEGIYGGKGTTGTFKEGLTITKRLSDLSPQTPYYIYVVMIDKSGNKTKTVAYTTTTTSALDDIHPYVTGKDAEDRKLVPNVSATGDINILNEFYIYFNEELDKETAENVNNYVLSGTGIVNVPGQTTIKPSEAIYSKHGAKGSKVLLKIPSLTGFINGDTLRVTVLPAVKDLAELEFTNADVVPTGQPIYNYAEYKHEDPYAPNIKDLKINRNLEGTLAEIEYTATKAGTIYYMILPEETDLNALGIDARDFVDEFGTKQTAKFNTAAGKLYLEGSLNRLSTPRSAELGTQKFNYDLSLLNPNPFISYKLFMVLRDRSGNLSPIESGIVIADKTAPVIGSLSFASITKNGDIPGDDTRATISIESDEKGSAIYKVLDKYVYNSSTRKYELNPLIYDGAGKFRDLVGTTVGTNEARETNFKKELGSVSSVDFIKGSINSFPVSGLTAHKEYVLVTAVKDTYGNFTTRDQNGDLMYKELYADGTEPFIINKILFRNFDNSFTLTFSEAIERQYVDTNVAKDNLTQQSTITSNTSLANLMTIKDDAGNDVTSQYKIKGYTTGSTMKDSSRLTIELVSPSLANTNRTITVTMKNSVVDQKINTNKGHTFDLNDFGKHVYRNSVLSFERVVIEPYTNNRTVTAIFDVLGTLQQFEPNELVKYYYFSYSGGETEAVINALTIEDIITSVNDSVSASLGKGSDNIIIQQQRGQITMQHPVGFSNDWVIVVIEDKYGNRTKLYQRVGYIRQTP